MKIKVSVGQKISCEDNYGDWNSSYHSVEIEEEGSYEVALERINELQYYAKKAVMVGLIKDGVLSKEKAKIILARYKEVLDDSKGTKDVHSKGSGGSKEV